MKKIIFMYLVMVCHIVFPASRDRQAVEIRKVNKITGEHSWKNLTDTAVISLPSKVYFQNKKISLKDLLQTGDPVQIYLGYNQTMFKRFDGFVTFVKPNIPVEVECENYMYKLKRTPTNFNYESIKLPDLLKNICPPEVTIDAAPVMLGSFKAIKTNVCKVLEKTKADYGCVAYFKDKTLICGKVYQSNSLLQPVATYDFNKNIKKDHQLIYKAADEVKLAVEVISNLASGKKISVEIGDPDGEKRTLNFYNITTEEELRRIGEQEIARLKYSGWRGSFNTFGLPHVYHTDLITLHSDDYPEKDGNYYIDTVKWSFDKSGYNNNIELGAVSN